jgi:hypothetical protein
MKVTSAIDPQLKYPFRVELLIRMIFLWLLLWGVALFSMMPMPHYSFYEDPPVKIVVGILGFLLGLFILQGFINIITHWGKFNLIIDKEGFHGLGGVSFIKWSEIDSIGDKTKRYNLLGQRVHFLTIRVRSVKKIIRRERGWTIWVLRLGKSPDLSVPNIKMKDIQSALQDIQHVFSDEIRQHGTHIYETWS